MPRPITLFGAILLLMVGLLWDMRQDPSTAWWMLIESTHEGNADIYLMRPDKRVIYNISNDPQNDQGADWSPETRLLVFSSNRHRDWDIYRMRRDGSDLIQLTDHEHNDLAPVWSPDGQWIVFLSFRDEDWELFRMRPDGSDVQNLTNSPGPDYSPTWSPDGGWIAFVSERDGNREIYRIRSDGTDLRNLTNHFSEESDPDWSPDGRRIIFSSDRERGVNDILRMQPDGSDVQFLTRTLHDLESMPHYSPDGQWILYNCLCDLNSIRARVFVMQADGSDVRNLTTRDSGITSMEYGPEIDFRWHIEHLLGISAVFLLPGVWQYSLHLRQTRFNLIQ